MQNARKRILGKTDAEHNPEARDTKSQIENASMSDVAFNSSNYQESTKKIKEAVINREAPAKEETFEK